MFGTFCVETRAALAHIVGTVLAQTQTHRGASQTTPEPHGPHLRGVSSTTSTLSHLLQFTSPACMYMGEKMFIVPFKYFIS